MTTFSHILSLQQMATQKAPLIVKLRDNSHYRFPAAATSTRSKRSSAEENGNSSDNNSDTSGSDSETEQEEQLPHMRITVFNPKAGQRKRKRFVTGTKRKKLEAEAAAAKASMVDAVIPDPDAEIKKLTEDKAMDEEERKAMEGFGAFPEGHVAFFDIPLNVLGGVQFTVTMHALARKKNKDDDDDSPDAEPPKMKRRRIELPDQEDDKDKAPKYATTKKAPKKKASTKTTKKKKTAKTVPDETVEEMDSE
jgi:hypothetical protein